MTAPASGGIAFSTLACPDWSWQQILERGPALRFDGVEIRLLERDTDLPGRPEFAADLLKLRREELTRAGFAVCGLASSVRFDDAEPAQRDRQHRVGEAYLDLAAGLGASFVRVFGDVVPAAEQADERRAALDRIAAGLERLARRAEELPRPVHVLLETHGDFADSRLVEEVMTRVRSPLAGVLWDTHHPWRFCGEALDETWGRIGPWVRHTHWKDSVTRSDRPRSAVEEAADRQARALMSGHRPADYVLFGAGEFPLAQCLRLVARSGYTGWYSYEWEKAWHPDLPGPEEALPGFPETIRAALAAQRGPPA